jgi:hypothetical protein
MIRTVNSFTQVSLIIYILEYIMFKVLIMRD